MSREAETTTPATLPELPAPAPSKRQRGDVLVIGGAAKTPGAVALTGLAVLRVGAGRLTVAVAESVAAPLAVAFPEAGVIGLPQNRAGSVTGGAGSALEGQLEVDCVVVGPGLDDAEEAHELLERLVPLTGDDTVVLLDAFALGRARERSGRSAGRSRGGCCSPRTARRRRSCSATTPATRRTTCPSSPTATAPWCAAAATWRSRADGCGTSRPATPASPPRAAATCSPARSPDSSPAASTSATPPAGRPGCTPPPATGWRSGSAPSASSRGSSRTSCPRLLAEQI